MHLPLDALGLLLVGSTVGYLGTSSTSGRTLRRFGALIVLAGATTVQVLGTTGFAVASSLLLLVAGAVGLGLGAGAIDATITSTVSLGARPSELNALQGVYCVGARWLLRTPPGRFRRQLAACICCVGICPRGAGVALAGRRCRGAA